MMKKLAIPLSILTVAAAAGCTTYEVARPANTFTSASIAGQPVAYRAGAGTVTKIAYSPSYSAAAGGSTVTTPSRLNRLTIRMDDGAVQYLDTDSSEFRSGMRVELLPDRTVRIIDASTVR